MKRKTITVLLVAAAAAAAVTVARGDEPEVQLSGAEFRKLEVYEGHALSHADQAYAKGQYRQAHAEYDAFILEFPRSSALPYALLRKARSLQRDNKRNEAVKQYQEVLDYFPNAVKYAAAARFRIGECHWNNGDIEEALKAWAKLADDKDYSKHFLAAGAINKLADNLLKQGRADEAVGYYTQVAADFRDANRDAANYAIEKAVYHHIRRDPDEEALRELYTDVGTFHHQRRKIEGDPAEDGTYWNYVRRYVWEYDRFGEDQGELRDRYYRYWAGVMDGRFAGWDDYRIDVIRLKQRYEKDTAAYLQRLDRQFADHQEPGDYGRIVKWIGVFGEAHTDKAMEYYRKLDFSKMDNGEIESLVKVLFDRVKNPEMAVNAFEKLDLSKMSDDHKHHLSRYFWHRDPDLVRRVCLSYSDRDRGLENLLDFYHWSARYRKRGHAKEGIEVARELVNVPQYAQSAWWRMAEMLQWTGQYDQAITAYRQADNPPGNSFRIAECLAAQKKRSAAVGELRQIENFFENHAPEAAIRIAHLYKGDDRKQYIAELRGVLKKYPQSRQSSQAHQELERMGIKTGGGIDAD